MKIIKVLLFLLPFVALVIADSYTSGYGGYSGESGGGGFDDGSDLPPDQVEEVLALYRRHCKSSSYGPPSTPGSNVNIHCKEGRDVYEPPKKQVIRIPPGEKPKKNILFVEAPAYKFKHQINLLQPAAQAPKTVIYVLQGKASHDYNVRDNRYGVPNVAKPQVFFLNQPKGDIITKPPEPPTYPPKPVYGLPTKPPSSVYGLPQGSHSPASVVGLTDLGPEYEVVPADSNAQNTYRNIFEKVQDSASSDIVFSLREMRVPSTEQKFPWTYNPVELTPTPTTTFKRQPKLPQPQHELSQPKLPKVSKTNKSYAELIKSPENLDSTSNSKTELPETKEKSTDSTRPQEPQEPQTSQEQNVLVQPLRSNLYPSLNDVQGGRVIFPSESIQNYRYSTGSRNAKGSSKVIFESQSNDNEKDDDSISKPFINDSTEKKLVTHTSTPESKRIPRLNLFDIKFVRELIESARNTPVAAYKPKTSLFTTSSPSPRFSSSSSSKLIPYDPVASFSSTRSNTAQKRSVTDPGFEIISAPLISYSYTKGNTEEEGDKLL